MNKLMNQCKKQDLILLMICIYMVTGTIQINEVHIIAHLTSLILKRTRFLHLERLIKSQFFFFWWNFTFIIDILHLEIWIPVYDLYYLFKSEKSRNIQLLLIIDPENFKSINMSLFTEALDIDPVFKNMSLSRTKIKKGRKWLFCML